MELDYGELAKIAIEKGANPKEVAKLRAEAEDISWKYLKGETRMVRLGQRDEARERLEALAAKEV